jgi:hypothetical protein
MGFEARIRERRVQALLHAVDRAVAGGNRAAAHEALDGLRELRPGSREVHAAAERLTMLEFQAEPEITAAPGFIWSRVFSAVSLLLVGVSLLVGLDWLRMSPLPLPAPPPVAALLPGLDRLHLPAADVAAASPQPRRHAASAAAKAPNPSNRVATARKAPPPSGWGKVFKPTARFFTTTLPKALGVQIVRDPAAEPGRGRAAI